MEFKSMNKYVLYFGRDINDQDGHLPGYVTDIMWADFMYRSIDPRFDGYTVQQCEGSWQGMKEATIMVTIMHDQDVDFVIEKICNEYCSRFDQDCVMVERSVVSISFVE